MSWFKENKFLAGLLIVTLLGAGVLGYFVFTAKGKMDEADTNYQAKADELRQLQSRPAFPDQQNLKVLEAQREKQLAAITSLQKDLAQVQFPLESMTPTAFQDRLRDTVTAFNATASGKMKLPAGFYMGFDPYQSAPPTPEAAPLLGRELKAIEFALTQLVQAGATELFVFNREEFPEEGHSRPKAAEPTTPGAPKKAAKEEQTSVRKHALDFEFNAEQQGFRDALNRFTTAKQQFFIPRYVAVANSNQKPPTKAAANPLSPTPPIDPGTGLPVQPAAGGQNPTDPSNPAAGAGANGAPAAPVANGLRTIVGDETVRVTMRLEVVNFNEPAAESKKDKRAAAK